VGDLINLDERRNSRSRAPIGPITFFFSLGCPISYLAAERVERAFGEIDWVPVLSAGRAGPGEPTGDRAAPWTAELLGIASRAAEMLRLPLVVPARLPTDGRGPARAAVYAAELGVGACFALAVSRMVFSGGFDLDDPEVLITAADACALDHRSVLDASHDPEHDATLEESASSLYSRGITAMPALRLGTRWVQGLDAVPGFPSVLAVSSVPLTPAG